MAAGEGRRMRPLSERWPKPVLPIDGRPVIASLMRELAASGLTEATVVTGHLAEQVEELLGDGSAFGVELQYVRQPSADGSADAVRRAVEAGVRPPFLVSAADTLFTPGDVGRFAEAFLAAGSRPRWPTRPTGAPRRSGASPRRCISTIFRARRSSCSRRWSGRGRLRASRSGRREP